MLYIEGTYNVNTEFPQILKTYFEGLKVGIFDIETTGLDPARSKFILGGLAYAEEGFPEGEIKIEQYFAEKPEEEKEALEKCLEALSKLDVVITYNGTRFDMPYIKYRAAQYGIGFKYDMPHNLDLYYVINKFSELRKMLPNLKQKTVENYFGLWETRTDEISGAESIELYSEYVKTGDKELLDKILLHNSDDVMQLTKLVPIVKKADVHRAMSNLGFPVGNLSTKCLEASADRLFVSGTQRKNAFSYYSYAMEEGDCDMTFDKIEEEFQCSIPFGYADGADLFYIDLESVLPEHDALKDSHAYESGYLVIRRNDEFDYEAINSFVRELLKNICAKYGE